MALLNPYVLPVTSQPNQTFKSVIPIGDRNVQLTFKLSFREVLGYWTMDITDKDGVMLLSNIPLVRCGNILAQYGYLNLGYLAVVKVNTTVSSDYPNSDQLGTDFVLVWGEDDD